MKGDNSPEKATPPITATNPIHPIKLKAQQDPEKIKEITDRLERGIENLFESNRFKQYLKVMSKFHSYSFNNTLLIAMQKPDATFVAGYTAWKKNYGRQVVKGAVGIKVIAPSPYKVKKKVDRIDPITNKPMTDSNGRTLKEETEITVPAYKVVTVFDVSQTEGREIPTIIEELAGNVEQYDLFFKAIELASPVPIGFEKIADGAKGYYHQIDKRIAINEDMSQLQNIKTGIHEVSHAKLHDNEFIAKQKGQQDKPNRRTKEVQAESIAYTVCQHYGLDTSDYSFGYIAEWSSGRELAELKASLEIIRAAAAEIINSIDVHFAELQKEREMEQEAMASFLNEPNNTFTIYQLKDNVPLDYHFRPFEEIQGKGLSASPGNYENIYAAPLTPGTTLEDIYIQFNCNHPSDFKGHSLSVSDVVVLHQNGIDTAYYVNSIGFMDITKDFLLGRENRATKQEQKPSIRAQLAQNKESSKAAPKKTAKKSKKKDLERS